MKVGVFVDLHGGDPTEIIETLNEADIILANGDFISCENKNLEDVLEKIASNSNKQVIIIPGNYEDRTTWESTIRKITKEYENIIDNNRKVYQYGDYGIVSYGGGTVRAYCASDIYRINPLDDISDIARLINEKTILQLHEPPKYYGDVACFVEKKDDKGRKYISPAKCEDPNSKKANVGHEWLTDLIEGEFGIKPRLVTAGHIHEAKQSLEIETRRETKNAYNLLINPGPARDGHYAIIEVNDSTTKVLLWE